MPTPPAPRAARLALLTALGTLCGCATVDPGPDFERVGTHVARATGQTQLFDPRQMQAGQDWITAALADGLTASEAAQIALLNNPTLQGALYRIGMARADLVQAGLLSNPTLGLALRLPSAGGLANLDFDLAQNIADLWQIPVRERAAARNLEQTILQIAHLAARTAADAKAACYEAGGAARRLAITRENLAVSETVVDLTRLRRRAGAGSELDVNLAQGVLLQAELAVKRARLAEATAMRSLATILGLADDPQRIRLAEPLPLPPGDTFDPDRLTALALDRRLDLQALRAAVASADERLQLQRLRVFPTLSVGVAFEREARERATGRNFVVETALASAAAGQLTPPDPKPRAGDLNTDFVIGPMIALELPLFDQNQARIARAGYELAQRQRLLEGLERSVRQEVRQATDQARTAWELARFYAEKVVPQAHRSLEMSRDSYRAGKSSILSVLDAERAYLAARQDQAAALQQAAAVVPVLERTVGLPLADLLPPSDGKPPTTTRPTTITDVPIEGQS